MHSGIRQAISSDHLMWPKGALQCCCKLHQPQLASYPKLMTFYHIKTVIDSATDNDTRGDSDYILLGVCILNYNA